MNIIHKKTEIKTMNDINLKERKGYIYIRNNEWYEKENLIKLGITSSLKERDNTYVTGEVKRGYYIIVIEIPLDKMIIIDKLMKQYFKQYNIYKGGGTEFYSKCIIEKLDDYLSYLKIEYRYLSIDEIKNMERIERLNVLQKRLNELNISSLIQQYKYKKNMVQNNDKDKYIIENQKNIYKTIKPNTQQKEVLDIIENYYKENEKGKINWACGLGKALLSILIVKKLKFQTVVFGVPNMNLQKQICDEILKIFPERKNILFVGGESNVYMKQAKTKEDIQRFLQNKERNIHKKEDDILGNELKNENTKFIITTYHSCYLLVDDNFIFDYKIGDEAHHLTGFEKPYTITLEEERSIQEKKEKEKKCFLLFHRIHSTKSLFMTATEKLIHIKNKREKEVFSMNDENIFGKTIDSKSVEWAIEHHKITDYNLILLKNTIDEVDHIISSVKINVSNKEIFISCYMTLLSMIRQNDLTHILLYTNTTEEAEMANNYITELAKLEKFKFIENEFYYKSLHSKNCNNIKNEINLFCNHTYGIISCVYLFGEGFDLPKLNGVCVAGNMQSEIRIVQYLLRPNRLEKNNPEKKAYIIIPYIDMDEWGVENNSYAKLRNVVYQMRNVDKNIERKLFLYIRKEKKEKRKLSDYQDNISCDDSFDSDFQLEENEDELNKLKTRLRYSKALRSNFTQEEIEYNYVRLINSELHIRSIQEYMDSKPLHNHYIDNPETYFKERGVWNGWYHFFGCNTNSLIQTKQEWLKFCREKKIKTLIQYQDACKIYDLLPKEPGLFYRDFSNVSNELSMIYSRRR